jgi:GTP-binding protein
VAVPQVAIVGRPNVGKSSLFNWLAGRRIAIVDPTAGVTRDRVCSLIQADGRFFELVDTGGIGIEDVDNLTAEIDRQIQTAMDQAAVVLFVVDARAGQAPLDEEVARRLRTLNKPVILVANKCDTPELEPGTAEFYKFGFGKPVCVSSQQGRGKRELLGRIEVKLPEPEGPPPTTEVQIKLAIVGRRNTGKSTFINRLAREERVIVSEVPGTTRDSIDIRFERDGKTFLAIDTAGVRRKSSIQNDIEFYSMARAERSIRRADVVLLFMDPRVRISKVDKQLADYILKEHKPAIFALNKWDLAGALPTGKFGDYVRKIFPSLDYVPMAFISAKTGSNVGAVLKLAEELHQQASGRVSTGDLNRVLRNALEATAPPMRQNRRPKVYYATQVSTNPPTIVLFTNGPELFDNTYQRYLLKTFRDQLPFTDVPIKMYLRRRNREDKEGAEELQVTARGHRVPKGAQKAPRGKASTKGHPPRPESELWDDV